MTAEHVTSFNPEGNLLLADTRETLREIRERYMNLGYEEVDSGPAIGRGNSECCGDETCCPGREER